MKKTNTFIKAILVTLVSLAAMKVHAQQRTGLLSELVAAKIQSERYYRMFMNESANSAEQKKMKMLQFDSLRIAVDQLIFKIQGDLVFYDGFLANRTVRTVKKFDKAIMGKANFSGRREVYKNMLDKINALNDRFCSETTKTRGGLEALNPLDIAGFVVDGIDKIRTANNGRTARLIEVLNALRIEEPTVEKESDDAKDSKRSEETKEFKASK